MNHQPRVMILMGSESDRETMQKAADVLSSFDVPYRFEVTSAHRTPSRTHKLVTEGDRGGVQVFICGAGMAAHLAGVVASLTDRPVIGVPLAGSPLNGIDALLSTAQMPRGVPVATVAIGSHGASNAAYLAIQVLALGDDALRKRYAAFREEQRSAT